MPEIETTVPEEKPKKKSRWGSRFSRSESRTQPIELMESRQVSTGDEDAAEAAAIAEMAREVSGTAAIEDDPASTFSASSDRPRSRSSHRPSIADLSRSMTERIMSKKKEAHIRSLIDSKTPALPRDTYAEMESRLESSLQDLKLEPALEDSPQVAYQEDRSNSCFEMAVFEYGVSAAEAYDFFTKEYPSEEDEAAAERRRLASVAGAPDGTERAAQRPVFHAPSLHPTLSAQVAAEDALFTTSAFRGDERRGSGGRLAEEGLYAGPPLPASTGPLGELRRRLGHRWVGADGTLAEWGGALPAFPLRPVLEESEGLVQFRKAVAQKSDEQQHDDQGFQIDVDISRLVFTHHPLFSMEHLIASRLLHLWLAFLHTQHQSLPQHYNHLLLGMKRAKEDLEKALDKGPSQPENRGRDEDMKKLVLLRREKRRLRSLRDKALKRDWELLNALRRWWELLERTRTSQGFAATSYSVLFHEKTLEPSVDRAEWESDLRDALQEELEEARHLHVAVDESELWAQLKDAALQTRRRPGHPDCLPILSSNGLMTPKDQCPKLTLSGCELGWQWANLREEQSRREAVERREVCLRLSCDGAAVLQTPPRPLNADFCLPFARIFSLQLFTTPAKLLVQILERERRGSWTSLAELGLAIPDPTGVRTPGVAATQDQLHFSSPSTLAAPRGTTGVGSGIQLALPAPFPALCPRTSGVLEALALWGRAKNGRPLAPPFIEHSEQPAEVEEEVNSSRDPVEAHIQSLMVGLEAPDADAAADSGPVEGVFRLEPPELALISEEAMNLEPRFRVLEYRREGVPEFRLMRSVPAFSRELDWDIFAEYERRTEKDKEPPTRLPDLHSLRAAGNRYLSMVRAEVVERLFSGQRVTSVSDVVSENGIPSCGTLGLMIMEEAGRPLKPVRKSDGTKRAVTGVSLQGGVRILINIQSALNLPSRLDVNGKESEMETVVEVHFQGQRAVSSAVSGRRPIWQQLLSLPFTPPNLDFSPGNLQTITDALHFNLFDMVETALPADSREAAGATVHAQKERRWLGGFRLPFSTLYHAAKIDGFFRIRIPPLLLSYTAAPAAAHAASQAAALKLLLAIDPPLQTPETSLGKIESIETNAVVRQCELWLAEQKARFPFRRTNPLVLKTDGRTALIPRFLRPIPPPPQVTESGSGPREAAVLAARIVALIPFIPDPLLFPGMPDIWSTCDEFVKMACGDEEEHAVLLWCWLAGLGHSPVLVMGEGLPEGPRAAYVLLHLLDGPRLFNASDGLDYAVADPFCPLFSVGIAVTPDNVWANVQMGEAPCAIDWDFERLSDWRPLFGRNFANPGITSLQVERLEYRETPESLVTELRTSLERRIKLAMDEWRQYANPRWNFAAAQIFRDILKELEGGRLSVEEHGRRLKELTDSYVMLGFPLHMGYESTEAVVEAVKATHLHLNFHPDLEFALACHVHAYPNNILSVWVYVASLQRRR